MKKAGPLDALARSLPASLIASLRPGKMEHGYDEKGVAMPGKHF